MSDPAKARQRELEAELVRRVAEGDSIALSELYDRYAGMLLALIARMLGDAEAEDVLQDAFVQVWRQAQRYDPNRSSVSTWLVMIARSRAIDRLRTRKVVERTREASAQENSSHHTSQAGVANVLQRERGERLRAELARLPSEQREVLELAFFAGLTQSEIAQRIGIPLGTVKTRTLLAMKKLREALSSEIRELL